MKRLITSILSWMEHADERNLEAYLAGSANVADLERRMREWEKQERSALYTLP